MLLKVQWPCTQRVLLFCAHDRQAIKRGMIRYLFLCIDLSRGMAEADMRPNRLAVTIKVFIVKY